jgi:hypothetical protein
MDLAVIAERHTSHSSAFLCPQDLSREGGPETEQPGLKGVVGQGGSLFCILLRISIVPDMLAESHAATERCVILGPIRATFYAWCFMH